MNSNKLVIAIDIADMGGSDKSNDLLTLQG